MIDKIEYLRTQLKGTKYSIWHEDELRRILDSLDSARDEVIELRWKLQDKDKEIAELNYRLKDNNS